MSLGLLGRNLACTEKECVALRHATSAPCSCSCYGVAQRSSEAGVYLLVPPPSTGSSVRTVQLSVLIHVPAPAPAELQELFPNIIPQLGQENMAQMRNLHAQMQVGCQA